MTSCTERSHGDLKHRDPNYEIDNLPLALRAAYADAVRRGCGCDKVARRERIKKADDDQA